MATDIKQLYGVGNVRAAAYARLDVHSVEELLLHYPVGYEDRGNIRRLQDSDGGKGAYLLTVATAPKSARIRGNLSFLKFRAYDDSGVCEILFFNQDFLKNVFVPGETFRFYGKVEQKGNRYTMSSPAYEPFREGTPLPPLVPVYPLTEGLSQKQVAKDLKSALIWAETRPEEDILPEELRQRLGLCSARFALRNIHLPQSFEALAEAKKRLIFEELFVFALGLSVLGKKRTETPAYPCPNGDVTPLVSALPYELTGAQKRVIEEIRRDLAKSCSMNRLLIGDVGCGKTVCAAAAMYMAVQSGRQAVLMAPTEILARQHYADLCELFRPLEIEVVLLCGSTSAAEKKRIYRGLSASEPNERIALAVGTHALLSDGVEFAAPGVVVVDEQHRFGVGQRAALAQKNRFAHRLVMSATPIPRTLALSLYGDLDVSMIDEMPIGRQRVETFAVDERYRERLDRFILRQTESGGQVYVVCPAIEEAEEDVDVWLSDSELSERRRPTFELKSATKYAEDLKERLPNCSVAVLHGKMKAAEKEAIMREFADGRTDILVSTTVIEVGVNVPNACLMIVENAERFGLSQLHQLRGRVGRGTRKSYCILVSESIRTSGTAHDRLNVMTQCYDGYAIAERDLEMRGPGDFLKNRGEAGFRQSGGLRFRLAQLCGDTELLKQAFAEAETLLREDERLSAYPALAERVFSAFSADPDTVG